MYRNLALSVLALLGIATASAHAQGTSAPAPQPQAPPAAPPYRFSGLVFGDYYAFTDHHLSAWEGQQGFWFRRLYFTYDHTLSPAITMRLRLEMNSNGKLAGGALAPYVKDAYLRWTYRGRQQMTLGIQPSLSFEFVENVWGLRHIEKPPLDLYRWDSSRDMGITLSGPMNEAQTLKYAVQYGNESGTNSETDKFKAYRVAARYEANPGFSIEGMAASFHRDQDADRTTAQVFAAYRAPRGRAGLQYSYQKRRAATGTTASDIDMTIISAFGVYDVKPRKVSVFVRVDRHADPCPDCSGIDYLPIDVNEAFTMTLVGAEYYVHPAVRFTPNVEWVSYSTPSNTALTKPTQDVAVRLTFFWTW